MLVDPALDDRRLPLDLAAEQDGHVIANVPTRFLTEDAAAGTIERERHRPASA